MNDSETLSKSASAVDTRALQAELGSLRALLAGILVALILISGCLNIYLKHQAAVAVSEAADAEKFIRDYDLIGAPSARDLWHRLNEYARTHPNFNPVIAKYAPYIITRPPAPAK
jgi:hypothetical protein